VNIAHVYPAFFDRRAIEAALTEQGDVGFFLTHDTQLTVQNVRATFKRRGVRIHQKTLAIDDTGAVVAEGLAAIKRADQIGSVPFVYLWTEPIEDTP
jgi:hypothetical protein